LFFFCTGGRTLSAVFWRVTRSQTGRQSTSLHDIWDTLGGGNERYLLAWRMKRSVHRSQEYIARSAILARGHVAREDVARYCLVCYYLRASVTQRQLHTLDDTKVYWVLTKPFIRMLKDQRISREHIPVFVDSSLYMKSCFRLWVFFNARLLTKYL